MIELNTIEDRFLRNKDLIPQDRLNEATVIGLGGIGSSVVMNLSIMGVRNINGYDNDTIKEHNLSTTIYPIGALGKKKAEAATEMAVAYGCPNPSFVDDLFHLGDKVSPVTFAVTDNMSSRKEAYDTWKKLPDRELFIDIRMGALTIVCVTINDHNAIDYMNHWFPDSEGHEEPCTMKHTIFTASIAAGVGIQQYFSHLRGLPYWVKLTKVNSFTDFNKELFVPKKGKK